MSSLSYSVVISYPRTGAGGGLDIVYDNLTLKDLFNR